MTTPNLLGNCYKCGYDLAGAKTITCPECGTNQPVAWIPESSRTISVEELDFLKTRPPTLLATSKYFLRRFGLCCLLAACVLMLIFQVVKNTNLPSQWLWGSTILATLLVIGWSLRATIEFREQWRKIHNFSCEDLEQQKASIVRLTIVSALQIHIPVRIELPWYKLQYKRKHETVQLHALRTDTDGFLVLPSNSKQVFFHNRDTTPRKHLLVELADSSTQILCMTYENDPVPVHVIDDPKLELIDDSFQCGIQSVITYAIRGIEKHLPSEYKVSSKKATDSH